MFQNIEIAFAKFFFIFLSQNHNRIRSLNLNAKSNLIQSQKQQIDFIQLKYKKSKIDSQHKIQSKSRKQNKNSLFIPYYKMYNKMMLPIELTKILYQNWQGQIAVSSEDSEIYGKCLNGPGKVTFKNGNKYEGQFYNGLLHGKGKFIWCNGIEYEGQFTDNRITGNGIYRWPDGSLYEGQVKDGLRHGFGKYTIEEATYEGEWLQGKKSGKGKIIFKSGSIFEGSFKNDLKQGHGKMYYYPSGNYFEGQWKNDKKEGKGTMNWTDIRQKYVGEWKNNHQEGWGMHIWLESKGQGKYIRNRYEGQWVNGVRQGYGVFYYANGSKYEGYWKDNMKQAFAFYTNENGQTQLILFKKDRMIRENHPTTIEESNGKKIVPKKQVEPNFYSLCLKIDPFYYPYTPNLELLYNYLLRSNTALKSWYKGISTFYDQQSEYSFCLNLEGAWKLIRSLKILGHFSLATLNRGLYENNPKVRDLLQIVQKVPDSIVNYEDIYYKNQAKNLQQIDMNNPSVSQENNVAYSFDVYNVHDREKNILFRQFIQLLVWISFNLDPVVDKPQKSVEKIVAKISPFLENISKMAKTGMNISEAMSDNKSSISKTEKNISHFFRNINLKLMETLTGGKVQNFIKKEELTIRVKDLLHIGKLSGVFGDGEISIFEKVIQKYCDPEVLNAERNPCWQNSTLATKILNIMNYELIEYEFSEIIYIIFVKKIGSHKETDENKKKYTDLADQLSSIMPSILKEKEKTQKYANQRRVFISKKDQDKAKLIEKRRKLEETKSKLEEKQMERQRQEMELRLMAKEDVDIKDEQFGQQQSEFEI